MTIFDFVCGNSVAVRKAFIKTVGTDSLVFEKDSLYQANYKPFNGDQQLIKETRKVIYSQTRQVYKHVFLTNGGTGGCTIALRAYAQMGGVAVAVTNPAPYFSLYPGMVKAAGLKHITAEEEFKQYRGWKKVFLLDTPTNPFGKHVDVPAWAKLDTYVIWDSVYYNNVYCHILPDPPKHDVAVGSFSKLTGLNGIRFGWIATDDDCLALKIENLIMSEYCGLCSLSGDILFKIIKGMDSRTWISFESLARSKLDLNRGEWSKLEKYLGYVPVSENGMFYYSPVDAAAKELFEKAGVSWLPGSRCGADDSFGRFNIGQNPEIVLKAVKAILKADKI